MKLTRKWNKAEDILGREFRYTVDLNSWGNRVYASDQGQTSNTLDGLKRIMSVF